MSAVDAASAMTEVVDRYAQLATLERAAMGESPHAARLEALAAGFHDEVQRLEASEPPRPPRHRPASPGRLRRWLVPDARDDGAIWDAASAEHDAWSDEVAGIDARTAEALEGWRRELDPVWLAAIAADRDAALRVLVASGRYPAHLVDFTLAGGFGDWHRRAAIAND